MDLVGAYAGEWLVRMRPYDMDLVGAYTGERGVMPHTMDEELGTQVRG